MEDFRQFFKGVKDPRRSNATRHDFLEMLMIALLSSLCGGQTCVDMADFAVLNEKFLRRFMRLEHGPPSHDAFSRLFRMMDPGPFAAALSRFASGWAKALEADGVRQIAVDGKALRRTFSRASELSPLHLLSAFAPGSGIVLGQVAVDKKSNEIRALPALLEMLSLEGTLVTADALHTQRAASELIIGKGGNYVLTLKANQKELHKDAKEWLEDPEAQKDMLSYQHVGCGHGRIETRTATVSHDVGWLQDLHRWPGLEAVGKVEAARETEGRTKTETRYLHHEPKDVFGGASESRPEPLGDREQSALGPGRPDGRGRSAEPDGPRSGEPRGRPENRSGHHPSHGRQALNPAAVPMGGANAGISTQAHQTRGSARARVLKCDCPDGSAKNACLKARGNAKIPTGNPRVRVCVRDFADRAATG